ncbi:MAG TPA: peptide deformylase, partial [Candidatus Limnocylindrales bacterium]|nr:peptide deformylase [Candidatus Limnocylindrales bacterium]
PQVARSVAISAIDTKPTPTRPNLEHQKLTIINPKITKAYGHKVQMREGCISGSELCANVPRYEKIRLLWQDEQAKMHEQDFHGFLAHVIQHEVDHLNGILFVDKVEDTTSYMTFKEFKKLKDKENKKLMFNNIEELVNTIKAKRLSEGPILIAIDGLAVLENYPSPQVGRSTR